MFLILNFICYTKKIGWGIYMDLVIMAAGLGSRFGKLKQVEPINNYGEFIIDFSVYDAIRAGFDRIVFIIKKENYEIFRETIGKRIENKIKVCYVFQNLDNVPKEFQIQKDRVKPLGTAHAILCCKGVVKGNFAIINADDFYGFDAFKTVFNFLKTNISNHCVVGYYVKNTLSENGACKRGICSVLDGKLQKIIESSIYKENGKIFAYPLSNEKDIKEISENTIVSMNMLGFSYRIFETLEKEFYNFLKFELPIEPLKAEYLIPNIMQKEIENGVVVKCLDTNATWFGVTYKEDKPLVCKAVKDLTDRKEYPANLWK